MKIVLAYSGGLDTSIIVPWLREQYHKSEVICVCINVGQEQDTDALCARAAGSGATRLYIIDARASFVEEYLFPLLRSGARYERRYFLGTAIARPLQASQQIRIAREERADAVAHGCTGKGNDQLRFELVYRALAPDLRIIAPWRVWDITSREEALRYARAHDIPLEGISEKSIYSRDENLWHISHEGGILEEINREAPNDIYTRTADRHDAPESEYHLTIAFRHSRPIAIDGEALPPVQLLAALNTCAARHAIGRLDIVETRVVGIKSRARYETPGGTLLFYALQELESITLSKELRALKQQLSDRYADLVYEGKWFSEERRAIEAFMQSAATRVNGEITVALHKGAVTPIKRSATEGLYDKEYASFGAGGYAHAEAEGFVKMHGVATSLSALHQKGKRVYDACTIKKYEL